MSTLDKYSIDVSGRKISFPREISKVVDFDDVLIVQTKPNRGETNEDWFKIDSIYGVSKIDGKIIWSRPGFEISKQRKEPKIILLNPNDKRPDEYELVIYAVSMNFYVNPNSGETIRQEQTK